MTTGNRPPPSKDTFRKTARLLDDFFKVDEYRGACEKFDNEMGPEQRLIVFERGDSVAALLFDPSHREVILVEQFRLPARLSGTGGWILEPAAGIIEPGETARDAIIGELKEETGYHVTDLAPIATFFVSPGGTTERIHLFYAEVRRANQETAGGGLAGEGENIRIVRMPLTQFFAKLRNNEFHDAKLIIAAQWLKDRRATMPVDETAPIKIVERKVKLPQPASRGRRRAPEPKFVGYMTGDILNVKGIDVWVNPLNTDMLLDRFTDRTVSARIRMHGAEKYQDQRRIKHDTIGEELRHALGGRNFVKPAMVVDTSAGRLAKENGVKRIVHVATTKGEIGEGIGSDLDTLERCVDNVLIEVERHGRYTSIVFPMLGTGEGGFPLNQVAPRLLRRAINFFQSNPWARLQKIYFLPFSEVDGEIVADAMQVFESQFEA